MARVGLQRQRPKKEEEWRRFLLKVGLVMTQNKVVAIVLVY